MSILKSHEVKEKNDNFLCNVLIHDLILGGLDESCISDFGM